MDIIHKDLFVCTYYSNIIAIIPRTLSVSAGESLPLDLQQRLSAGELALLLSHRRVWYMIAMDSELEEEDWALVLEEDAMLHPEV